MSRFRSGDSGYHSFWVIPGTIPAEFEFRSRFCQNHHMNLAGLCAKFDSSGILGIAQILLDSSRSQWRTVKTSCCCCCLFICHIAGSNMAPGKGAVSARGAVQSTVGAVSSPAAENSQMVRTWYVITVRQCIITLCQHCLG